MHTPLEKRVQFITSGATAEPHHSRLMLQGVPTQPESAGHVWLVCFACECAALLWLECLAASSTHTHTHTLNEFVPGCASPGPRCRPGAPERFTSPARSTATCPCPYSSRALLLTLCPLRLVRSGITLGCTRCVSYWYSALWHGVVLLHVSVTFKSFSAGSSTGGRKLSNDVTMAVIPRH